MKLEGIKVAALVANGFEEVELTEPRKALQNAGAMLAVISPRSETVRAWNHDDWGDSYAVDRSLDEADPAAYDALLLPGGVLSPDKLRTDERAIRFVKHFFDTRKPVAAICHGAQTLITANVVSGRRMTGYEAIRIDLRNAGATVPNQPVVVDGNLVTSRNPGDLPAFNERMIEVLAWARADKE